MRYLLERCVRIESVSVPPRILDTGVFWDGAESLQLCVRGECSPALKRQDVQYIRDMLNQVLPDWPPDHLAPTAERCTRCGAGAWAGGGSWCADCDLTYFINPSRERNGLAPWSMTEYVAHFVTEKPHE